ncbi:MAG: DUF2064 domain-containing protein [Oscillochloridaceae bacterium]|nr:DUF2064 domain-containing protein [Chloroflexaceae bacterium]MDW8391706.1 DUF2064 domain-containing protein [Oscillochloridaceae bacterium]
MTPTLIVLADTLRRRDLARPLGPAAMSLFEALISDTVDVAREINGARVLIARAPHVGLDVLPSADVTVRTLAGAGPKFLAALLKETLEGGEPTVVVGGDLPHLPPWRLRDALTHLAAGAGVVVGPQDREGWYLLGLRSAEPLLLRTLPARDENPEALLCAARGLDLSVAILPSWFGVNDLADLEALASMLRDMPATVARRTRAVLAGENARAVGG